MNGPEKTDTPGAFNGHRRVTTGPIIPALTTTRKEIEMYFTRPNIFKLVGTSVLIGIVVGIAIGLGIALIIQMNILMVDLIIPGTAVYY